MNELDNPNNIEHYRETNKIGLELFVHHLKENSFNDAVNELIKDLQKKLNNDISYFLEFQVRDNISNEYLELGTNYLEDKLLALSEMNIVYTFKEFEINIKKLLSASFEIDSKKFFKWNNITDFLKSKEIKYSELKGYQEINQLRKVNNFIKHDIKGIDDSIKSIQEFSKLKYMRHQELSDFFNRIRNMPNEFLEDLSAEIFKNLYHFDDVRLEKIAIQYAKRMDVKTATKFIEKLKNKY